MARYFDISVPAGPETTVFPGDPVPEVFWPLASHERGDAFNLGVYHGVLHFGTHADAPWHFIPEAKRLDQLPLDRWVGPCWVAEFPPDLAVIHANDLDRAGIPAGVRRLLLKTRNSHTDYWLEPFRPDFVCLHASAAQWCVDRKIMTVGLDYITIDPPDAPDFPAHTILLANETAILEGLALGAIVPGEYELIAAPIRLLGVDGAWCRALLRATDSH